MGRRWQKFKRGVAPMFGRLAGTAFEIWLAGELEDRRKKDVPMIVDRRRGRRRRRGL